MLGNKSTKVFAETNSFFTSNEKGIYRIMELYRSLKLNKLNMGLKQAEQSKYSKSDILLCLLLFPVFSIKDVHGYCKHSLSKVLEARKNTFYRFKNNCLVNWRNLVKSCNKLLFKQVSEFDEKSPQSPKCLIIDDTDFEKTSYKTEHISKIWPHVKHRSFFGFKGLFLCLWDGKSLFSLDFSTTLIV